jgi:hypothetical protein
VDPNPHLWLLDPDPHLWLMDPDLNTTPFQLRIRLLSSVRMQKKFFSSFFLITCAHYIQS